MIPVATSIAEIYQWLEEVKDPEIPVLSLVDLGVITEVAIDGQKVKIELTPTFAGCPAMEVMKSEIIEKLKSKGIPEVEVQISFRVPWSSEFIQKKEKKHLRNTDLLHPPPTNCLPI